jgi:hypothetical protein
MSVTYHAMYCIELTYREQRKLFSYLAETYSTQPPNAKKKFLGLCKKNKTKKCLIYPSYGKFKWHHKDDIFYIKHYQEGNPISSDGAIEFLVRCYIFHENLEKITAFLNDVFDYIAEIEDSDASKVKLFVSKCNQYCSFWDTFDCIRVQPLESIFIDKKIKSSLIDCIDKFIVSEEKYTLFGRNHKLNLLFTGIPGSGKTSLCKALAKKYGYSIYIVNFNKSMTDEYLITLTSDVKNKSIILYEDIDVFFTDRMSKDINVSFSCLINILDGTLTKGSGNINIITTNYPDKIDSALLRPGRIDKIMRFDYPKKDEIKDAFKCLIADDDAKFAEFFDKIKNVRLTMSAIIDYLFQFQEDYLDDKNIGELLAQQQFIQDITKEESSSKLYN